MPAPPALPLPESAIPTDGHRIVRPGPHRYFRQESEREGVAAAGQFLLFGAEKGKTKGSRPWAGATALVGLQEESRAVLEELHLPGDPCAAQSQHAAPEPGTFRVSGPVTKGKERLKKHQRALAQQDADAAVGWTSAGQTTPPCWREEGEGRRKVWRSVGEHHGFLRGSLLLVFNVEFQSSNQ